MNLDKRKASAERRAVRLRNYQRVRGRALSRLAQENPTRYKELLEQERARDEADGKTWFDISGRTSNASSGAGLPNGTRSVSLGDKDADEGEARHNGTEA